MAASIVPCTNVCESVEHKEITADYVREVFLYNPDTGELTWKRPTGPRVREGDRAGHANTGGHLQIKLHGRNLLVHRLIWLYVYGVWPVNQVDHINRNRTDNRIVNLREATKQQNSMNMGKFCTNTSGHNGVHPHKGSGKWQAQITFNYKVIYLGLFESIEEAVAARKAGELRYWGAHRAD